MRELEVPQEGLVVWLKDYGYIKLFRTHLKDQVRHYAIDIAQPSNQLKKHDELTQFTRVEFTKLHDTHWQIEQYHRVIKQVCHIEHFQVRNRSAVETHIFAGICAYVALQRMKVNDLVKNCYQNFRHPSMRKSYLIFRNLKV